MRRAHRDSRPLAAASKEMLSAVRELYARLDMPSGPAVGDITFSDAQWPLDASHSSAVQDSREELVEALRNECASMEDRCRHALACRDIIIASLEAELSQLRNRPPRVVVVQQKSKASTDLDDDELERMSRVLELKNAELDACRAALDEEQRNRGLALDVSCELKAALDNAYNRHAADLEHLKAKVKRRQARADHFERLALLATAQRDEARELARNLERQAAQSRVALEKERESLVRALEHLQAKADLVRMTDSIPL